MNPIRHEIFIYPISDVFNEVIARTHHAVQYLASRNIEEPVAIITSENIVTLAEEEIKEGYRKDKLSI